MNRSFLSVLNWRRNIRGRLFWTAYGSFMIALSALFFMNLWLLRYINNGVINIANFLFLVLTFLLVFYLFTRPIVRRMRAIADGLMAIAQGNLAYRVPQSSEDELGQVAKNINYMAEQLQDMMNRERQTEMSKMELITNVSHDLRTPLTSIIGYLNLLENDDYRNLDEHRRYIRNASLKTQQLKKLIDDLFEYTRLTGGGVRLSLDTVDLTGLLDQMLTELEPLFQEQNLALNRQWDRHSILVQVDTEKFVRAVENLLMNALKFSVTPGEIAIRLTDRGDRIFLAIENRGLPITAEQEQRLFDRFYKAESSRGGDRLPAGSGLGLSIARSIIELHGGRIGLDHRDGRFVFSIVLPRLLFSPIASNLET